MSERDELVARLREGTFGSDVHKTDVYLNAICSAAADQIERDGLEIERLRKALSECLGTLTGGMDGTWTADSDPISMARAALNGEGG